MRTVTGRPLKAVDPNASAAAKLGAELRDRRLERNLTLAQLGNEIGFSAQYISGAELARTTVSARFVEACDRALDADGVLVALLPHVLREKKTRRNQEATAGVGSGAATAPIAARDVDPALPEHVSGLLAIIGAHDAMHGPREALGVVHRELQLIAAHRQVARGDLKIALMRVEARWTVYAAWLCEDTGDRRGRAALLERALRLACESDYPDLIVWARARQAQWADPPRAIRLAGAGLRTLRSGAHTRALCAVRAAHAHAQIADADTTARLLAQAHELAAQWSVAPPLPADTSLSGHLVRCWEARCWAALDPAKGVALYDEVLRDRPCAVGQRDGGLYMARLAIACAGSGELDRARAEGRKALAITSVTNSATAARELRRLRDILRG